MLRGSIGVYFVVTKKSTEKTSAFNQGFLGEESTTKVENMLEVEKMILPEVVQIKLKEVDQRESDLWIYSEEGCYEMKESSKKMLREETEKEMLEGKAVIEDTDMPLNMQAQALSSASRALDLYEVFDCIPIAAYIKKDFDKTYGPGWQCVVGTNFSCFFTHFKGTFIYFALETLNFLIFKGSSSNSTSS
ncbi:uncharacterized protein LOC111302926 isoform X3 [Durio zibethinus]|uniref:Uncharacterized protein LOC111302926 isoform X3 n=1 Tax=Durio zibethinus TaxID=66656 RepID=A0A6P5ZNU4_DURZI|nr:uncharacterized protein LOC111302926 isoform X3 [Durio zibethinus]